MFQWFGRKRRIDNLCREHARAHGLLREYELARANGCPPEQALEEWDMLTPDVMMKIQAEYNQTIDIELPPPHEGDCTVICIESIGVTIRIRERAADAPPRKTATAFPKFIIDTQHAPNVLSKLHAIIDGKAPKQCALAILAAIEAGLLTQPTFAALRSEFPEIGTRPNYAYYLARAANYASEIAAIRKNL